MLFRLIRSSFANQRTAMALMIVAVAFGTALTASLLTVSFEISDKVAQELRAFGANITVEPRVDGLAELSSQARFLNEGDLRKIKTIFWRHNILGFAPFLETRIRLGYGVGAERIVPATGTWYRQEIPQPGEDRPFTAGIVSVSPWWNVEGDWPGAGARGGVSAVLGRELADELGLGPGDPIILSGNGGTVSGIVSTGDQDDRGLFLRLEDLQAMTGLNGKISRVLVSALSTPMDDFAYKDPGAMTRAEYEKWYCTGYVTSIAKQLEEVMTGSRARPVWKIAETEGQVLSRLRTAIYLLCAISLLASAIGVGTTMVTSLLRRTEEIGLMKAVGADSLSIVLLFLSEALLIGLLGGLAGLVASAWISRWIGLEVFGTVLSQRDALIPLALGLSLLIAVGGSLLPIARALRIQPAVVLKGAE